MIAAYLVSHAFSLAVVLVSLAMQVSVFDSRRTPQSTVAWALAILFLPFVAIPLYLLLGSRKFPRRAKRPGRDAGPRSNVTGTHDPEGPMARLSRSLGVAPARPGHAFELLPTGELAYARLLELIASTKRSIDLTMFILGDDETGWSIVDALAARARAGVKVRLILDAVGCRSTQRKARRLLAAAGAEARVFMPLRHSPFRGRTNLRSHRKIAIFDGEHLFAGGMNLADEYMGKAPRAKGATPRWRDVAAVATGPAAEDAGALFESDWEFCGGTTHPSAHPREKVAVPARGDAVVQLVASGPDMIADTVYDLFLTSIFAAKERVAIVTPYYVPDEPLQHALVLAARRGVRTEVLVPSRSNHSVADIARGGLLRELTAAGVHIHYYGLGMVHAKAMVVDDTFAYIGSPNFDMRSLFLNYEDALCLYSKAAIADVRTFIDGLFAECAAEAPRERRSWVLERIARLLAPEL